MFQTKLTLLTALCIATWFTVLSGWSQVAVQFKDFSALGLDRSGKRSVLKGSDARQATNGMLEVINARVDLFKADNSIDLTIETPQCFYLRTTKLAWSPSELTVKTGDGRFSLQGSGFSWQQNDSSLVVSNHVRAIIQRNALSTDLLGGVKSGGTTSVSEPIHVTSGRLEYVGENVVFRDQVRVKDGNSSLSCEVLRLHLGQGDTRLKKVEAESKVVIQQGETKASGGRGSYDLADGRLRLEDAVTWQLKERSGRSDWVQINRTNNTVLAGGTVHMVLPMTSFMNGQNTNVALTQSSLEISSKNFEYRQNPQLSNSFTAVFTGKVNARESRASLTGEKLTIEFLGTNQLSRVLVEQKIELLRGQDRITGDKAVYQLAQDQVTVTGDPVWQFQETQGRAQSLKYNTRTRGIHAETNVEVDIPTSGEFTAHLLPTTSGKKPAPKTVSSVAKVTADQFYFLDHVGTFDQRVQVTDTNGVLNCGQLQFITGSSNQLQRLQASGGIVLKQADTIATGQLAIYTATNGVLTLSGSPKIVTKEQQITAAEFRINRARGTFEAKAPYEVQVSKERMKSTPVRSQSTEKTSVPKVGLDVFSPIQSRQ